MAKKKPQPKPIFWITGNHYESQKAFNQIAEMLGDCRITVLDCDFVNEATPAAERTAGPEEIIKRLLNRDIFDTRPRIIKLKGLPHGYSVLVNYLKHVNNNNVLVIDGPIGHRAKPPSKQFVTAKTSNFYKRIKKEGKVLEFPIDASNPSAATNWLKKVAEEKGKPIEPDAAALLVEMRGCNLDFLYGGLLTLIDFADGKTIKRSDVETVCTPEFLKQVWDLLLLISHRKYEDVAIHMQRFYEAGALEVQSTFVGQIEMMLGAFNQLFTFAPMVSDHLKGKLVSQDSMNRAVNGFDKVMKKEEFRKALEKAEKAKAEAEKDGAKKKPVEDYIVYTSVFTSGFIAMKARDEGFKRIVGWGSKTLHEAYVEVNRVRRCVRGSSGAYQKLCLDSLMMVLCGKLQPYQSSMLRSANFVGIIE